MPIKTIFFFKELRHLKGWQNLRMIKNKLEIYVFLVKNLSFDCGFSEKK